MKHDICAILFKVSVHNEAGMKEFEYSMERILQSMAIYVEGLDNVQLMGLKEIGLLIMRKIWDDFN